MNHKAMRIAALILSGGTALAPLDVSGRALPSPSPENGAIHRVGCPVSAFSPGFVDSVRTPIEV
jgi:hypothetical protein